MSKSKYPDPDGYIKMRVRDFIACALVVSFFAMAVLLNYMWSSIVKKTISLLRATSIRLADRDKQN